MRRGTYYVAWFKNHRPSGVISGWLLFFIVSYVIIVKLDTSSPNKPIKGHKPIAAHDHLRERTKTHPSQFHGVPKQVLEDFAKDHLEAARKTLKLKGIGINRDDSSYEPNIELAGVNVENELMLFHELEGNEEEIEENWKNYLDKDKIGLKISPDKALRFQGIKDKNNKALKLKVILPKLPKYVSVFDALSEGKKFRNAVADKKCVLLKTMHGDSPICIHDPEDDEIISSSLFERGSWEPNFLYITGSILKLEPELLFLDLGCNIGVYTILAARLDKTVVAVDPNKQNLRLLTKSLSLTNARDKVTLMCNAISDRHENVSLVDIVGNIGGTFVETSDGSNAGEDKEVVSIMLDDLIELFKDKAVFIKMDIETYEWKALQGAKEFFEVVDVRYILMEWIAHRSSGDAQDIIDFLTKRDLYPHVNNHHNTKLEVENSHAWPDNVLWIKY